MSKLNGFSMLAFAGLLAASVDAWAVSSAVILDFSNPNSAAYYGSANLPSPFISGSCPSNIGSCYQEDDMVVGVVNDPRVSDPHLHYQFGKVGYRADSSGIYIRAKDGSSFSLLAMDINAVVSNINPGKGVEDYWEIIGFNVATNPGLSVNPTANQVALQSFGNGFDGTLALSDDFGNINAFWIHSHGWPVVPYDKDEVYGAAPDTDLIYDGPIEPPTFAMTLDNVKIASPVPAPTAAWMMLTGVMGLLGLVRRKPSFG